MSGAIETRAGEGGVLRISINRPEKRNALTHPLMQALGDALVAGDEAEAVRAILLDSPGPVFCAGADLANLSQSAPEAARDPGHRVLMLMAAARKPLVAAVQGPAVGMGATMLLHCDAIYAAPDASLRMPFVELGLTPEGGATFLLPQRIGHVAAAQLLLLAEPVGAASALAMGLVTAVVPSGALAQTALASARRLAALPADALAQTKAMMRQADLGERMDQEQVMFRSMLLRPEFLVGVEAMQARLRKPA